MAAKNDINFRFLIFWFLFIIFLIVLGIYNGYNSNKEDYKKSINFVVHKKKDIGTRFTFFNKDGKKIDLYDYYYDEREIFTGDSLVKYPNSYILYVYRKEDYYSNIYFKVDSIYLENR